MITGSKSAHYKRAFIESFYDKELKLALKSGNKDNIKKVNKIWSFLLSHDLITKHPCSRSHLPFHFNFSFLGLYK